MIYRRGTGVYLCCNLFTLKTILEGHRFVLSFQFAHVLGHTWLSWIDAACTASIVPASFLTMLFPDLTYCMKESRF